MLLVVWVAYLGHGSVCTVKLHQDPFLMRNVGVHGFNVNGGYSAIVRESKVF